MEEVIVIILFRQLLLCIKNKELLNFMNKYWLSCYHANEYFWGHEYNKHGYCYNQRKGYDVNDYEKYFQKSKEMFINNNFDSSDDLLFKFFHILSKRDFIILFNINS